MKLMEQESQLTLGVRVNKYLNHHRHSEEAYKHVVEVLQGYEFALELARSRAVEKLEIPNSNVLPFPAKSPPESPNVA